MKKQEKLEKNKTTLYRTSKKSHNKDLLILLQASVVSQRPKFWPQKVNKLPISINLWNVKNYGDFFGPSKKKDIFIFPFCISL